MAKDLLRARAGWRAVYCFQCVGSWVQLPEPQRKKKKSECTQHTQMSPETVGFISRPPGPMQICRALLRNDQLSKHTLIWLVQSIKWRHLLCTQKHHEQANKHPTAVPNSRLHPGCFVWFLYHFQSWKVNIYSGWDFYTTGIHRSEFLVQMYVKSGPMARLLQVQCAQHIRDSTLQGHYMSWEGNGLK